MDREYIEASAVISTQMCISMLQTLVQYGHYPPALALVHIQEAIDTGTTLLSPKHHRHLPEIARTFVEAVERAQGWARDNPPSASP